MAGNVGATLQLTTGTKAGTPTYRISAGDRRATPDHGFRLGDGRGSIAARQTRQFMDHIVVTYQGAQYAT
jgi:hypothetical protein